MLLLIPAGVAVAMRCQHGAVFFATGQRRVRWEIAPQQEGSIVSPVRLRKLPFGQLHRGKRSCETRSRQFLHVYQVSPFPCVHRLGLGGPTSDASATALDRDAWDRRLHRGAIWSISFHALFWLLPHLHSLCCKLANCNTVKRKVPVTSRAA